MANQWDEDTMAHLNGRCNVECTETISDKITDLRRHSVSSGRAAGFGQSLLEPLKQKTFCTHKLSTVRAAI